MKAGDKVIVIDGALNWEKQDGWRYIPKDGSYTLDGRRGVLIEAGCYYCTLILEGDRYEKELPTRFISPIICKEESDKEILLQALEHYGVKNQAAQLMGEMGELAAELTRHFFQGRDRTKEIAEEITDVLIMLEQMILHLGIEEEVAKWRSSKLKRLKSRMNQAG